MEIQKSVMLQFGASTARTRSPEAFEHAMKKAKGVVGAGLTTLAGPAGALLTGGGSGTSALSSLQQQQQDANLEYLKLQMEVQNENRQFTTLSNVLKSRHDTARAAINNLRT